MRIPVWSYSGLAATKVHFANSGDMRPLCNDKMRSDSLKDYVDLELRASDRVCRRCFRLQAMVVRSWAKGSPDAVLISYRSTKVLRSGMKRSALRPVRRN